MASTSTAPKQFSLNAGQVSAGLARDRLWHVRSGSGRLRFLVGGELIGEMPLPESGWFVVPESAHLRVCIQAETPVVFEARLPMALIPRLGDLGRAQLVAPIRQMMTAIGIDDSLVDWPVKLSQPTFRTWLAEALDRALVTEEALSPDMASPLISENTETTLSRTEPPEPERAFGLVILAGLVSVITVLTGLLALRVLDSPAFGLDAGYGFLLVGSVIWIGLSLVALDRLGLAVSNARWVSLGGAWMTTTALLFWENTTLGTAMLGVACLVALAYWIYVRRLLPDLPSIDQPMRWLSIRLTRDGVPSVRARVRAVWQEATEWVVARIELVAEYSRFSRAILAAGLVIPAMAGTYDEEPAVLMGLSLTALVLLERLRGLLPVEGKKATGDDELFPSKPLSLGGEVHYESVVFRRHAGEKPLFDELTFHAPAESLVRITAAEGTGLSTLKHLLIRKVAPEKGRVRIGGMDVARLDASALSLSVVMLDHPKDAEARTLGDWLFIDPVIEAATLESHLHALKAAHLIELLKDRLNAPMGAVAALAGPLGMHRLKLARALARPGQILWLDHWLLGLDGTSRSYVVQQLIERPGTRFVVDRNGLLTRPADLHWEVPRA